MIPKLSLTVLSIFSLSFIWVNPSEDSLPPTDSLIPAKVFILSVFGLDLLLLSLKANILEAFTNSLKSVSCKGISFNITSLSLGVISL